MFVQLGEWLFMIHLKLCSKHAIEYHHIMNTKHSHTSYPILT